MKKALKIIYSIFIAFIVAVALLLIISIFPITGNYKMLVVVSGSMEPEIHTGSVVVVKPSSEYKIGDIITFGPATTESKPPTTHRILEMRAEQGSMIYLTKGDANDTPDQKEVRESDIMGKVLFSVPYLGFAIDFAKKPIGFFLIIIIPAIVIIFDEVKKIVNEIKKKKAVEKGKTNL